METLSTHYLYVPCLGVLRWKESSADEGSQVDWDSGKDAALWKILSGAAQREIDCTFIAAIHKVSANWPHREPSVRLRSPNCHHPQLTRRRADRFNVPIDFLLQQVAYLNEQHASQVRRQVRMATAAAKSSAAPSPIPGSDSAAANPRTPSSSSLRRDSPLPRNDGSSPGTPLNSSMRPVISRNASANTTVLRDGGSLSPRPGKAAGGRASDSGARRRLSSLPSTSTTNKSPEPQPEPEPPRSPSPGPAESSSTSTSEDESSPAQSRIIRRPPRFHQQEATQAYGDDDDESEPAFQPYQEAPTKTSAQDLASTLRGDGRSQSRRSHRGHRSAFKEAINRSQTSDSSGGSGAMTQTQPQSRDQRTPGPLSPRRPAEAGHSPSGPAKGAPRDGSDGTPSMGSSFSDLDGE